MDVLFFTKFPTHDDAYVAIQRAQADLGFGTAKARTRKGNGCTKKDQVLRVWVRCDRSGQYRKWTGKDQKYITSSKKTGCPWSARITWNPTASCFAVSPECLHHNHEPHPDQLSACTLRRQSQVTFGIEKLEKLIAERSRSGQITARELASQITTEHPHIKIVGQDVRVIRTKLRRARILKPFNATEQLTAES
ncbi:hypothetical protein AK830_g8158 [Neonectria ditissima]|uniref:FAR1 domain-containing protein n=1 Tax=Neonectria ditissima TaxID=78410 RepID=A0A0P7BET1_9HYPO|nr:hypothetical protein AK830_g8158 [Neonectria ditissima]